MTTGVGAGAAGVVTDGVGVGAGVVGGGVVGGTVVGVAVGVSMQVQVGEAVAVVVADVVAVGWSPRGAADDASAEWEANNTVKLVAASVMLARPAIFARFVIFKAVTRCLLGCDKSRTRGE